HTHTSERWPCSSCREKRREERSVSRQIGHTHTHQRDGHVPPVERREEKRDQLVDRLDTNTSERWPCSSCREKRDQLVDRLDTHTSERWPCSSCREKREERSVSRQIGHTHIREMAISLMCLCVSNQIG